MAVPEGSAGGAGERLRLPVLEAQIDVIGMAEAVQRIGRWAARRESRSVCICNAHSVVLSVHDARFRAAVSKADLATPDGAPVAWMLRRQGARDQARVSGPDLMLAYLAQAEQRGESIYLYGSTGDTLARLEAALTERYIIKRAPVTVGDLSIGRTEYRFRGDTSRVAFTESTFRLATDTNSPSVARSMVDVAEARNWKALRVSGNDAFKRLVWLEASVRGVRTLGYEPNPGDLEVLKREREARLVNHIEPARDAGAGVAASPAEKASARGSGGRKAVLAAIEAVLVARRVPDKQREAVMAAATEKLAQRLRDGHAPKVKVYDKAAPSQRPVVMPVPEMQRSRDRAAPTPVR